MKEQIIQIMKNKFSIIQCKNQDERNQISKIILDMNPNYTIQISKLFDSQIKIGPFTKKNDKRVGNIVEDEVFKRYPKDGKKYIDDVIKIMDCKGSMNSFPKNLAPTQKRMYSIVIDLVNGKSTYLFNEHYLNIEYFVLFNKVNYWVDNPKVIWITEIPLNDLTKEIKRTKLEKDIFVYQLDSGSLIEKNDIYNFEEEVKQETKIVKQEITIEETIDKPKDIKQEILYNMVTEKDKSINSDVLGVEVLLTGLNWYKFNPNVINDLPLTLKEYYFNIESANLIGVNKKFNLYDSNSLIELGNFKGNFDSRFKIEIVGKEKEYALYVLYDELKNYDIITEGSYDSINERFKLINSYLSSTNDDSFIFTDTDYKSYTVAKELINVEINKGDLCCLLMFDGKIFNISTN